MEEVEEQRLKDQSKFIPLSVALSIYLRSKQFLGRLPALCKEVHFMPAGNCAFPCQTGTLCAVGQFWRQITEHLCPHFTYNCINEHKMFVDPMFMDWFMPHTDDIYLGIAECVQKVSWSSTSYFEAVSLSSAGGQWKAVSTSKDSAHLALSWQVTWNLSPKFFFLIIKGGLVQGSSMDITKRKIN